MAGPDAGVGAESAPQDERAGTEIVRCLICGGCVGCAAAACAPCECGGVDGEQDAVCDRGGGGHRGRRYVWVVSTTHGEVLVQQYCEAHVLLGNKRANATGLASWARAARGIPRSWRPPPPGTNTERTASIA